MGRRFRSLLHKEQLDNELHRELAFHFELLVAENAADGMAPAEARRTARRSLGHLALFEDQCRDHRRVAWFHDFWQDVVYGLRLLRKNPGFTLIAVVSLALALGTNTAVMGVIDAIWWRDLAIPDIQRLVVIRTFPRDNPSLNNNASIPEFFSWKEQIRLFQSVAASMGDQRDLEAGSDGTPAERINGQVCSPALFRILGIQPSLGRVFAEAEDQVDNPAPVIVISHRLWLRRFRGAPDVIGKTVRINGVPISIIGVMPPAFQYPNEQQNYWAPLPVTRSQLLRSTRFFLVTARLQPGVSVGQVQAELKAETALGIRVQTLRDVWFGWTNRPLLTIEAAVFLLLLIACINLAGLMIARGSARQREMAVRVALGAGRGRIIRQLLTENMLLSLAGGLSGILVAWTVLRYVPAITPPPGLPRITNIGFDGRMLAMTAFISLGAALVFGLAPAVAAFQLDLNRSLKESAPGAGTHGNRPRLRGALVVGQIAFAFMLLTGAGLLINSFLRLVGHDLHFDPNRLLTFELRLPPQQYLRDLEPFSGVPDVEISSAPARLFDAVSTRLRALPGAESVAGISFRPVNSLLLPSVSGVADNRRPFAATYFLVTPAFFATLKAPLLRGREFSAADTTSSPWLAVINETAARRFWPGENSIGKQFTLDLGPGEQPRQVIGIVADIPLRRIQIGPEPVIYTSYLQQPSRYRGPSASMFGQMTFVLRASGDPMSLLPGARSVVAEIDPNRSLGNVATIERHLSGRIREGRDYALAIGLFALAATLLAAMGLYGVMAYSVAQRTREIGVRMALGGRPRDVLGLVGTWAGLLIAIGLTIGLVGSLLLTPLIASQLWGIAPTDPVTFAGVSLLLALVGLLACSGPARRATRVDPTIALRSD